MTLTTFYQTNTLSSSDVYKISQPSTLTVDITSENADSRFSRLTPIRRESLIQWLAGWIDILNDPYLPLPGAAPGCPPRGHSQLFQLKLCALLQKQNNANKSCIGRLLPHITSGPVFILLLALLPSQILQYFMWLIRIAVKWKKEKMLPEWALKMDGGEVGQHGVRVGWPLQAQRPYKIPWKIIQLLTKH